ncbi:hypothetical protein [Kribbella sp. NPDC023855]|uniref:hypothetical protein n=1 Tax=Kribbella sp. NPDC023855 TaxID=3154698 RepID=UPI0033D37278
MEALSVVVNSKLVADDVRHSVGGDHEVRLMAAEALQRQRREHRVRNAFRRAVLALTRRRSATAESVVDRTPCMAQSSGD